MVRTHGDPLASMAGLEPVRVPSRPHPTRPAKRTADVDVVEGAGSKRPRTGSQGLPFLSFFFFFPVLMLFVFAENPAPIRRSDRSTKGQGGALKQMQATSEAVQSTNGLKKMKSQVQNIPDNIPINPMAPAAKKPVRRYGKANVCSTFFWIASLLTTR